MHNYVKVINLIVLSFFFTTSCMDDKRPAGVPSSMDDLPNSKRNTMAMIYILNGKELLNIHIDTIMHNRDKVASVIVTIKGDKIETEINRLYLDL